MFPLTAVQYNKSVLTISSTISSTIFPWLSFIPLATHTVCALVHPKRCSFHSKSGSFHPSCSVKCMPKFDIVWSGRHLAAQTADCLLHRQRPKQRRHVRIFGRSMNHYRRGDPSLAILRRCRIRAGHHKESKFCPLPCLLVTF